MRGDRGVSDVISFVLLFSLVASTVGIVSVYGFDMLETVKDGERINNGERAFDVLADNLADIHERSAPSRVTEIDATKARLQAGSTVTMNLTGVSSSGPNPKNVFTYEPIEYVGSNGARIVYSGGAVFRVQQEGGVIVVEPPTLIESDRILFPVVQTEIRGNTTSFGGESVQIRAEKQQQQPIGGFTDDATEYDELVVTLTTPRTDLWSRYFEAQPETTCQEPTDGTLRCTIANTNVDRLYAARTLIHYEFET